MASSREAAIQEGKRVSTALAARAIRGDEAAANELVAFLLELDQRTHDLPRVPHRIRGQGATQEDLRQETMCVALERIESLSDPERTIPWTYRIAQNSLRNHYRRECRLDYSSEVPEDALRPPMLLNYEAKDALRVMISKLQATLSAEDLDLFLMHHVAGITYKQVALEHHLKEGTARVRVHRARIRALDALTAA